MKTKTKGSVLSIVLIGAVILASGYFIFNFLIAPQKNNDRETPNGQATDDLKSTAPEQNNTATETSGKPSEFKQYAIGKSSSETVNAANQFAFELYNQYKNTNDNVFFSPYSISSALEMTYEGARGATANEIQSVLHFPADAQARIESFAKLYSGINPKNATYQLSTANALWAQKSYPFDANYAKTIETYYGGKTTNVDFVSDTETSRQTINSWVSSKTNAKIPELFAKGTLDKSTRLVLTNAVYFKGKWSAPFQKEATQEKDFTTAAQSKIKVAMMNRQDDFGYTETADYQTVELPYENNDLSMIVVLPKNGKTVSVEKNLSEAEFKRIRTSLKSTLTDVYLPKFKFDTEYNMNETLSSMGMPTAFDLDKADFTGMYEKSQANENLYIGIVVHKAYVDVNEEGTEAAAATGVGMFAATAVMDPPQPKIFNADHPFIFAIIHNQSGSILFMGKVNDPAK
ncbi:MAG: serpin family protein [Candidatus Paceibacterota bacterium]